MSSILQKYVECQNAALYKKITAEETESIEKAKTYLSKACETLGVWSQVVH